MTRQQLLDEAMRLDPTERLRFIEELQQTVSPDELSDDQRAQVRRRIEQIDENEITSIEGSAVLRDARNELRQRYRA